jgi:hypothetical protein
VYDPRGLADLGSLEVKSADIERNGRYSTPRIEKEKDLADWIISMFLVYPIGWCIGLGFSRFMCIRSSRFDAYWC